ncbi:TIGR04086 family membrane protein [Desulfofalx alkaliphila]|uniref:TIGR04086 family membrane protein n=1 Tax=Desulfofalx alkaliphila TaxID=105483 RepID=UPI00068ADBB8|nr:TIGR04086 family membrane protein [Desulfofalx alkaliphila]
MQSLKNDGLNNQNPSLNFSAIFQGTLAALIASLFISMLAGAVYYLTGLSESTLPWLSTGILCFSVFIGGGYASARAKVKGLYHGLGVGIMFFIILWLVALIFLSGSVLLTGFGLKLLLSLVSGAIGGILGVSF